MAFDRRVRDELRLEVERTRPDLDGHLAIVHARSRHIRASTRRFRRAAGAMAATLQLLAVATLAAVIALVIVLRVLPLAPSGRVGGPGPSILTSAPPASESPSSPDFLAVAGTYSTTLSSTDAAVSAGHLVGTWTITFERDGTMTVVAPQAFPDSVNGISGVSFSLDGDRFRTDLFYSDYCQSIGAYRWVLAGSRLTFTADGDTCAIRTALLSTAPWNATP